MYRLSLDLCVGEAAVPTKKNKNISKGVCAKVG